MSDNPTGKKGYRKIQGMFIRRKVTFRVTAAPKSTVYLAGSFNDWNPTAKQIPESEKEPGVYTCFIYLIPGRYEYKFIINGIWDIDPNNPNHVQNDRSSQNSVLVVE